MQSTGTVGGAMEAVMKTNAVMASKGPGTGVIPKSMPDAKDVSSGKITATIGGKSGSKQLTNIGKASGDQPKSAAQPVIDEKLVPKAQKKVEVAAKKTIAPIVGKEPTPLGTLKGDQRKAEITSDGKLVNLLKIGKLSLKASPTTAKASPSASRLYVSNVGSSMSAVTTDISMIGKRMPTLIVNWADIPTTRSGGGSGKSVLSGKTFRRQIGAKKPFTEEQGKRTKKAVVVAGIVSLVVLIAILIIGISLAFELSASPSKTPTTSTRKYDTG